MKSSIPLGVVFQAGLILAKPYPYEKNGIVYDVRPRDDALDLHEEAHMVRDISLAEQKVDGA